MVLKIIVSLTGLWGETWGARGCAKDVPSVWCPFPFSSISLFMLSLILWSHPNLQKLSKLPVEQETRSTKFIRGSFPVSPSSFCTLYHQSKKVCIQLYHSPIVSFRHFAPILSSGPESAHIDRAVCGRDQDEARLDPAEFRQHAQFPRCSRVEDLQARGVHSRDHQRGVRLLHHPPHPHIPVPGAQEGLVLHLEHRLNRG